MIFDKYINLLYKHKGRDFGGVDCYGIIWLIYKEELGIILPDYNDIGYEADWYKTGGNHIIGNVHECWYKIIPPYKKFDILLFYMGRTKIVNHCGLVIGDNKFIDIREDTPSELHRIDKAPSRLYGAFRYKGTIR